MWFLLKNFQFKKGLYHIYCIVEDETWKPPYAKAEIKEESREPYTAFSQVIM